MNYSEEIEKRRIEIKLLEKLQVEEIKKSFPNIIDKIYQASSSTLWKIKEVTHIFKPTHCLANVITITVNKSKYVEISTSSNVEIDIVDMIEVTEEIFNEHIEEAIKCLRLQAK
jgi:hypothetical protein